MEKSLLARFAFRLSQLAAPLAHICDAAAMLMLIAIVSAVLAESNGF